MLTIQDGGRGFDWASAADHEGLGLASMRERLRSIGGQIAICSQSGLGTTIEARVSVA
jgi:signal transduction histidine kinase